MNEKFERELNKTLRSMAGAELLFGTDGAVFANFSFDAGKYIDYDKNFTVYLSLKKAVFHLDIDKKIQDSMQFSTQPYDGELQYTQKSQTKKSYSSSFQFDPIGIINKILAFFGSDKVIELKGRAGIDAQNSREKTKSQNDTINHTKSLENVMALPNNSWEINPILTDNLHGAYPNNKYIEIAKLADDGLPKGKFLFFCQHQDFNIEVKAQSFLQNLNFIKKWSIKTKVMKILLSLHNELKNKEINNIVSSTIIVNIQDISNNNAMAIVDGVYQFYHHQENQAVQPRA